jgi:hypothetical protein
MVELSNLTKERVASLFSPAEVVQAERLLAQECAENLPLVVNPTPEGLERLRFAAIRLSEGRLDRLLEAIAQAKTDWRDLLVASGFANDTRAHLAWLPRWFGPIIADQWARGELQDGVKFRLGAVVEVQFGPRRGKRGTISGLVALEPEPRYMVDFGSGEAVEQHERTLK